VRVIQGGEVLQTVQLPGVVDDAVSSMTAAVLCIDTAASVPQLMLGGGSHLSTAPEGYCDARTTTTLAYVCESTTFACDVAPSLYECPPSPPPAAPPAGCVDQSACPLDQPGCLLSSNTCSDIMRLPGQPADGSSSFTCECPTQCTASAQEAVLMPAPADECVLSPSEAECRAFAGAQGLPFAPLTNANEGDNYPSACFQTSSPPSVVWNPFSTLDQTAAGARRICLGSGCAACGAAAQEVVLVSTSTDKCGLSPTEAECTAWAQSQGLSIAPLTDASEWDNYPMGCFQASSPQRVVWNANGVADADAAGAQRVCVENGCAACAAAAQEVVLVSTSTDKCGLISPTEAECTAWAQSQGLSIAPLTDASEWDSVPTACFQASNPQRVVWNANGVADADAAGAQRICLVSAADASCATPLTASYYTQQCQQTCQCCT